MREETVERRAARPLGPRWALVVLWLAGASVRLPLLAVPPVLPAIHHALGLSETAVGLLTGIPVALAAAAAVLGSWLVARVGPRRALLIGLILAAMAGGGRSLGGIPLLYAMTAFMGLGVAIAQPALPSLAQRWLPRQAGRATAVYSNGVLIGEIAPVALTTPLILGLLGGGWALALLLWAIPVGLTALAVLRGTPRDEIDRGAPPARWWPYWHVGQTWRLGLILGCASVTYQAGNTFIPEYVKATGQAALITPALTGLNLLQLPASLLITILPGRLIGRRTPFIGAGILSVVAVGGLLTMGAGWVTVWAGLLGFAAGAVFILSLALPPRLAMPGDVHRLSAAMLTIAFLCGLLGPLCGGALWDLTRRPATAFAAVVAANVLMILLTARATFDRAWST